MSLFNSMRRQMVPVHPEGYLFILAFALTSVVLHWLWAPLGWIGAGLTVWCVLFFRDPARLVPQQEGLVLSPADGIISAIEHVVPPPELALGDAPMLRISTFMSVFNCHVNRAPLAGRIETIAYTPGIFLNADLDKASEDNERNGLVLVADEGNIRIGIVQIAGLIARRIVCFVEEEDRLDAGQRFGLIRFGSRVDVYLPDTIVPLVGVGAKAVAGETVLADLRGGEGSRRQFRTV